MSVKNVYDLFYRMDHNLDVKEKVNNIISKYSSPSYAAVDREEIIAKELIPLGKELGLEFTLDEFTRYLIDPSLQKLYETARLVRSSPKDPDFGKKIAARGAEKFTLHSILDQTDKFHEKNYGINEDDFGSGNFGS